jgi:hypothetical protein
LKSHALPLSQPSADLSIQPLEEPPLTYKQKPKPLGFFTLRIRSHSQQIELEIAIVPHCRR